MRLTIISGGQTGVDQGALRAAKARGVPTGGWAPKGWLTETADGRDHAPAPWLADYGLKEHPSYGYPARTTANIRGTHATLIVSSRYPLTGGTKLTFDTAYGFCSKLAEHGDKNPGLFVAVLGTSPPEEVVDWLRECFGVRSEFRLNVAGPRESSDPGIGARAEAFVGAVLDLLGAKG